jgi:hypothetical protein
VNTLAAISLLFALALAVTVVATIAYVISRAAPPLFGDNPGGRDPNLPGQFTLWGNGPNYIDFFRAKRRQLAKKRKERKR